MKCACEIDDYDSDENEDYFESTPVAVEECVCCECHEVIEVGDKYEDVDGKSDGRRWNYKTCLPCVEIRSCFFCTWIFGQLFERLECETKHIKLSALEQLTQPAKVKFFSKVDC